MTNQDLIQEYPTEFVGKGLVEDLIVSTIATHISSLRIDNKAFEKLINNLTDSVYIFVNEQCRSHTSS